MQALPMPTRGARTLVIRATLIYFAQRRSNAEILVRDTRGRRGCRTHRAWLGGNWGSSIRNDRTNLCGRSGIREKIKAFQFFVAEKRSLAGNWND
jgi:hypothetical protein